MEKRGTEQSNAAERVFRAILEDGHQRNALGLMHTREDTYKVIDYHAYEQQLDRAMRGGGDGEDD